MGKRQQVLQVTKSNFPQALEKIKGHIEQSHCIAISTRKTGSYKRPWHRVLPIDTPRVAYLKAKAAAESYELLQFAVCPFRFHASSSEVLAFPYNFHLFPRDELHIGMPSYSFSCQASFLTCMAHEGFDFNACVNDGISYLSREQESRAKVWNSVPNLCPIPTGSSLSTADKIFTERTTSKVRHWRDACKGPSKVGEDALSTSLWKIILGSEFYGSRPCLTIDVCSTHQVQLISQALSKTFDDIVPIVIPSRDGGAKAVRAVLTNSEEDKNLFLNELQNQEEEHNRKFRGFREVVDLISCSHKPVVAYDCLNEFTFIHSKFLAPLPPSMTEFMSSLRMAFSYMLDVNHLLKELGPLRKVKNLPAAISYLRRQFCVPLDMKTPQEDEELRKNLGHNVLRIIHVFAKLCSILEINPEDAPHLTSSGNYTNDFLPCSTGIQELVEEDVGLWLDNARKVSTDHLVFIWGFVKGTSIAALRALLRSAHSSFLEDFEVKQIDKNCAVIIFAEPDLANAFLEDMKGGETCPIPLIDLIAEGLNAASYGAYKRICFAGLWDADLADLFDKYLLENKNDSAIDPKKEMLDLFWPNDQIMSLNEL